MTQRERLIQAITLSRYQRMLQYRIFPRLFKYLFRLVQGVAINVKATATNVYNEHPYATTAVAVVVGGVGMIRERMVGAW